MRKAIEISKILEIVEASLSKCEESLSGGFNKKNDGILFDSVIRNSLKYLEYVDSEGDLSDKSAHAIQEAIRLREHQLRGKKFHKKKKVVNKSKKKIDLSRLHSIVNGVIEICQGKMESSDNKKNDSGVLDSVVKNGLKILSYTNSSDSSQEERMNSIAKKIFAKRKKLVDKETLKSLKELDDLESLFYIWQFDIKAFAEDVFGLWGTDNPKDGLTHQQIDACDKLSALMKVKFKYQTLTEAGLSEEEEKEVRKQGMAIRSGKGPGKTFITSLFCLWMLTVYPKPQVVVYSPKEMQTKQGLWKCFRSLLSMSKAYFREEFDDMTPLESWISIKGKVVDRLGTNKESKIALGTINASADSKEMGESVAGQHADYQMVVVDEASKVPTKIIQALEQTNTDPMNVLAMISNPTRESGMFREAFRKFKDFWIGIHWNAEDSPRVSKYRIEALEKQYGRNSVEFKIAVSGEFPGINIQSYVSWDDAQDAIENVITVPDEESYVILGLDFSGSGSDRTAYTVMKDGKCLGMGYIEGDPSKSEGFSHIMSIAKEFRVDIICGDGNGVGHGPCSMLEEASTRAPFEVHTIMVQRRSFYKTRYNRVRDQLYMSLREKFEKGMLDLSVLESEELSDVRLTLTTSLTTLELNYDQDGRLKMPSKQDMRKILGFSPDLLDSLALTCYVKDEYHNAYNNVLSEQEFDYDDYGTTPSGSWMVY